MRQVQISSINVSLLIKTLFLFQFPNMHTAGANELNALTCVTEKKMKINVFI